MKHGYIFSFEGHGAFDPDGKIAQPMSQADIDTHNRDLAALEIEAMKANGRALLYEHNQEVGTWDGSFKFSVHCRRSSRHNFGCTRTDLWFKGPDGAIWHGVNIGDNQIVRCRRNK